MKNTKEKVEKCIGCGLCKSFFGDPVEFGIDSKGFMRPFFPVGFDKGELNDICPLMLKESYSFDIWGKYKDVYVGNSIDGEIRRKSSSGGIITQILVYLLEKGIIDCIIQIGASRTNPFENSVYLSDSKEEIINNSGSRYAPASLLPEIDEILKMDKIFAFVGKPCEVRALKNYAKIKCVVNEKIPFMISFFCAGTPSYHSTYKLIENLKINKNDVSAFSYRGNGWPGFATAKTNDGKEYSMSYEDSWGNILGRDVQPFCRWCADGIGEFADISCGDAWYLDNNNNPIFTEAEGRNIIFARTKKGFDILNEMQLNGYIEIEKYADKISLVKNMQKYQFYRRGTMLGKILALKLMRKDFPCYKLQDMFAWSRQIEIKYNFRSFLGTILRILKGKI